MVPMSERTVLAFPAMDALSPREFDELLAEILRRFMDAPAGRVHTEIRAAQALICDAIGIDRSVLWEVVAGPPPAVHASHVWTRAAAGDIDPQTGAAAAGGQQLFRDGPLASLLADTDVVGLFPWLMQRLLGGTTHVMARVDDLPPEAAVDAASFRHYGTRANVILPLKFAGAVTGILSFATTRLERDWPPELVMRLEFVARIFTAALGRREVEGSLQASQLQLGLATARMQAAIDVAGLGFFQLSRRGGVLTVDARSRELLGLSAEPIAHLLDFWIEHVHTDDRERIQALIHELTSGSTEGATWEYRYLHDQRGIIWLRHSTRVVSKGDTTSDIEVVGVLQDVTQERQHEDDLRQALADVERLQQELRRDNVSLREEVRTLKGLSDIRGNSPAIQRALAQVEQVASTSSTVLLLGETGSGKERFAEAIHARSARRDRAMVRVSCAAIPTTLIESELFGREKGAYTGALSNQAGRFELAHGSTLFLDEIGELPLDVQSKLLRVFEEKTIQRLGSARTVPIDVRIIVATNRDLETAVREGAFREDLFYRINVFAITVPPLRDRLQDIPLLVRALIQELSAIVGKRFDFIDHRDLDALVAYTWPGNVRELRNTIERAMIISTGPRLRIPLPGVATRETAPTQSLEQVERAHVLSVLRDTGWRVSGPHGAAKALGLRPTTLEHRMKRLGIARPGHPSES